MKRLLCCILFNSIILLNTHASITTAACSDLGLHHWVTDSTNAQMTFAYGNCQYKGEVDFKINEGLVHATMTFVKLSGGTVLGHDVCDEKLTFELNGTCDLKRSIGPIRLLQNGVAAEGHWAQPMRLGFIADGSFVLQKYPATINFHLIPG